MIAPEQLNGFLLMHAGFRTEFGRLAEATRSPRGQHHSELLEEQLAVVLDLLHAHHAHEDETLWPKLIARCPEAAGVLAELEAEHTLLDPLIAIAGDHGMPLSSRTPTLQRLHEVVNDHLDHEERVAVPIMLEHLTDNDIEADKRNAMDDFGRRRIPMIFGWLASCAEPDQFDAALTDMPVVARLMFRCFWRPSYQRRFTQMYGDTALVPAGRERA